MSILKKSFKVNFTQVPNFIINDKKVSLKAKGLYLYMVSKPDNWEFKISGIVSQNKDKRDSVISTIKELESFGYLDKIVNKNKGKFITNDYILHLEPRIIATSNRVGFSVSELPSRENRVGKTLTSNTNTSNTIKSNIISTRREDFNNFREDFKVVHTKDHFYTSGIGYLPDTPFILNLDGLIINTVSNKFLNKEDAYIVWNYLYDKNKLLS